MRNNLPSPEDKRTEKRKLGDIGENVACEYLLRHGYEIVERNYLRKWGELDIIAKKAGVLHFVEVKSIRSYVSREKVPHETYRPEDNLHPGKLRRLYRTIETYLLHKKHAGDWQLDLITARIDLASREARVELIENIVG